MAQQRIEFEPIDFIDFEPIDFTPEPEPEPKPEKKGLLRRARELANSPIFGRSGMNADITQVPAALMDIGRNIISNPQSVPSMLLGYTEGAYGGLRDLLSPLNIADAATGFGKGKVIQGANKLISGLVSASGTDELAQGNIPQGLAELFGGLLGFLPRGAKPKMEVLPAEVELPEVPRPQRLLGTGNTSVEGRYNPVQGPIEGEVINPMMDFNVAPRREPLALPPAGDTALQQPSSTSPFYVGKHGVVDPNDKYYYDTADPVKANNPAVNLDIDDIGGEVVNLPPEIVAGYGPGLGQLNPPLANRFIDSPMEGKYGMRSEIYQPEPNPPVKGYGNLLDSSGMPENPKVVRGKVTKEVLDSAKSSGHDGVVQLDKNGKVRSVVKLASETTEPRVLKREETLPPVDLNQNKLHYAQGGEVVNPPKKPTEYSPNKFDAVNRKLSEYDELIEPEIQKAARKPGRENLTESQNKLLEALELSGPLNRKQKSMYSAEKAARIQEAIKKAENLYGSEAVKAYKSALKGEYEKVSLPKLEQVDVEALLNDVMKTDRLTNFERIHATEGLERLFEGRVPQPSQVKLLSRVFGEEISDLVKKKLPLGDKAKNILSEVVNLPRALMATGDFSAPLRQGLPLIHRKEWWSSLRPMFQSAWDEKAFKEGMELLRNKPTFEAQQRSGLQLTDLADLTDREERLMSTWAERVPGVGRLVRGSNRAYTMFLNKLRSDTFDSLIANSARASGGRIDPASEQAIAEFINNATGRGSLGRMEKYANALNSTLFSPRLQASRVKLINQTLNPYEYWKADPVIRKEALKSLFSIVGVGGTLASLASLTGTGEVSLDSNSSDFGKIKIGNTRIDPYAGFQQYAVLADRMMRGSTTSPTTGVTREFGTGYNDPTRLSVLQNFGESKVHPTLGLAINLLRGTNYMGQPVELEKEMMSRSVPIIIQDMMELYKEDPALMIFLGPALFGMGVSSYGTN